MSAQAPVVSQAIDFFEGEEEQTLPADLAPGTYKVTVSPLGMEEATAAEAATAAGPFQAFFQVLPKEAASGLGLEPESHP